MINNVKELKGLTVAEAVDNGLILFNDLINYLSNTFDLKQYLKEDLVFNCTYDTPVEFNFF